MLPFDQSEYRDRISKVKAKMIEQGIEVLLVSNPANMYYLTGYDGWSFYVHQLIVIIVDEEQPIWIGRNQDANAAMITTWLLPERIIPYADDFVHSEVKHPMDFVAKILHEIGQANRTIGLEMDAYYFSAKCYTQLRKRLQNASFIDATLLVNWVRIIKSPTEIAYMRNAAQIAEKAMAVGIESIEEGVRECDVAAKIYHAQISGTDEFGGDYPAIAPLLPSGEKTSTPHLTWTDQKYKQNEPTIIELAGCYRRYHCPLSRTVFLGKPPQKMIDLAKVVIEGLNLTLESVRPGMTCEEIEQVWRTFIAKHGLNKEERIGYSMGLNYPPDWGEHTASIRVGDKTIVEPNMTFHLIPAIWLNDYGFEISESFQVTESGCQSLADFPRQLFMQ